MSWLDEIEKEGLCGTTQDEGAFFVRVLTVGDMGSGKTHFAGTFPKPLLLNFDQGQATLTSNKLNIKEINFPARSKNVFKLVTEILRDARGKTGPFGVGGKYEDIETIVIDSATALGEALLYEVCMYPENSADKIDLTKSKATFDQWNFTGARLRQIFQIVRDLPFNVVVTALPTIDKDKDGNVLGGFPDLPGSFRKDLGGFFDEVYFMNCKKVIGNEKEPICYETYSVPFKLWNAKTRWGIPPMVKNMNYKVLKDIMDGILKNGKQDYTKE